MKSYPKTSGISFSKPETKEPAHGLMPYSLEKFLDKEEYKGTLRHSDTIRS